MRRRKDRASTDAVVGASEIVEKLPTVQVYAQERREEARYEALLSAHGALERALFVFHRAWTTVMQLVVQSAALRSRSRATWRTRGASTRRCSSPSRSSP